MRLRDLWRRNQPAHSEGEEQEQPLAPDEDPFTEPVVLEITDVIDLHSVRPREVKAVVEEYLRLAHERGFTAVRIIHGKGIGVQRETVREILARTPFVATFADAPPEAGGTGATIAEIKQIADAR